MRLTEATSDVEISDDVFIIRKETADAYKASAMLPIQEPIGEAGEKPAEEPASPLGEEGQPTGGQCQGSGLLKSYERWKPI
jgi:hypothetical protein